MKMENTIFNISPFSPSLRNTGKLRNLVESLSHLRMLAAIGRYAPSVQRAVFSTTRAALALLAVVLWTVGILVVVDLPQNTPCFSYLAWRCDSTIYLSSPQTLLRLLTQILIITDNSPQKSLPKICRELALYTDPYLANRARWTPQCRWNRCRKRRLSNRLC